MPRIVPNDPNPRRWEPAYPFGDRRDAPLNDLSDDPDKWTLAPPTSHCWGFRFVDARKQSAESRLLRKFTGKGESRLFVRFKDEKTGGVAAEYVYKFADHAAGERVFEDLTHAAHPYGAVVRPVLIGGRVPYERVA